MDDIKYLVYLSHQQQYIYMINAPEKYRVYDCFTTINSDHIDEKPFNFAYSMKISKENIITAFYI